MKSLATRPQVTPEHEGREDNGQRSGTLGLSAKLQMPSAVEKALPRPQRRPLSRLQLLRLERQFRLGGREDRIRKSLEALEAEPTIQLTNEEWVSVLEELKNNDF
jgi:hypothetical protein